MHRRSILILAASALAAPRLARAGLPDALGDARRLDSLRAVAIWRGGEEVAAQGYGRFTPDSPANIKSASKSIISALAGIAIDRGVFNGADQTVASVLSADLPSGADPRLRRVTLGNLLSMQAGLERQSGANSGRWVSSRNWVRAALAAPFVDDPGGRMLYSTASSHLVSAMLTRAAGRSTLALARAWLGGIKGFAIADWERDPQGIYLGGNQMAMSTRALMRFGAAYAAGGGGVIPSSWITESWRPRTASIFTGESYGYGWFLSRLAGRTVNYGWGYGGQMIYVAPAERGRPPVAIAMTSDPEQPSGRTGYREALHGLAAELLRQL